MKNIFGYQYEELENKLININEKIPRQTNL